MSSGADVAHHQELVGQLACGVEQREVFLVGLHREDEAFLRHIEELFFKLADEHIGALDQRGHFVEQRVVFNGARAVACLGGGSGQLAGDFGLARGKAGNHGAVALQHFGVLVGVRHHHRAHQGFKTVALRGATGAQAQRLDGHHGRAVQRDQAVRGAHKVNAAPAGQLAVGLQLVAHHLGDGQLGNGLVQGFLQAGVQRGAGDQAVVEQRLGLAIGCTLERGHSGSGVGQVGAQCLQFFQQGGRGLALGIQAHAHGHEFLLNRLVLGLDRHMAHMGRQPARRGVGGDGSVGRGQALRPELVSQHRGEGIAQLLERLGGQLFHKQFDEKILGGHGIDQLKDGVTAL